MRKPYDLLFDKYHQRESHFKHIIDGNVNELKKQQFYEMAYLFHQESFEFPKSF